MHQSPARIESLENRRLFSISLNNHVLNIHGVANQPNTITVGLTADGTSVVAQVSYPTKRGIRTESATFALSRKIKLMNINGGNKADIITVDQTNGSFPILAHVNTHNGNDTYTGGDEPDRVQLGGGIDVVNSGNGNDTLFAGRGPDTLISGDGNDQLHAGKGHDLLNAGNGNNTLIDPVGHNTLLGGTGHDTFVLKNIHLNPVNSYNPAKDKLKKYSPVAAKDNVVTTILNDVLDYYLL